MFVFIQNDLINANHIVSCQTGSGVTVITLDSGKRLNIPTTEFEANVLPLLPMLKAPSKDLTILPPEEVQVEKPVEPPDKTVAEPQEAKQTAPVSMTSNITNILEPEKPAKTTRRGKKSV